MNRSINKAIALLGGQSALARACGVSQPTVNKWVNGGNMDVKHIVSIIKATDGRVTAEEIRPDVDWAVIKGVN
ncbi:helix-turn-helix domain-containing protein [Pasteurella multocida]|uniref:Helix-turn-helix domain-containing protein n=1 Tax=Pasteurella multocida TaxID=747 RepID=A0AAW8V9Z6_PASMD|nr:helix-turn-helix domain-containing protein [Pasteurella multocida]MCL7759382.1 helix-turn-helix domain-containing protein [Pasteurella multocida]MDH7436453.1 helix-turn-helix domain-containing protein [Pasteurella multocida]MDH7439746.1 helix-turn-helix domain-containing protein [Pasteurella multocida]MDT3453378.1 helix-turn-helix domain-containing protein [Pasteurella multocida]MDX3952162.1 helix-turn-helix domain-containing protein [Pasteurella multocida]